MGQAPAHSHRAQGPGSAGAVPAAAPVLSACGTAAAPGPAPGPPRSSRPGERQSAMGGAGSPGSLPAPGADSRGAGMALTCGGGGDNPGRTAGGDGRRRWSQGGGRRARTGELLRAHVTCGSAARPLCRDTPGPAPPSRPPSVRPSRSPGAAPRPHPPRRARAGGFARRPANGGGAAPANQRPPCAPRPAAPGRRARMCPAARRPRRLGLGRTAPLCPSAAPSRYPLRGPSAGWRLVPPLPPSRSEAAAAAPYPQLFLGASPGPQIWVMPCTGRGNTCARGGAVRRSLRPVAPRRRCCRAPLPPL